MQIELLESRQLLCTICALCDTSTETELSDQSHHDFSLNAVNEPNSLSITDTISAHPYGFVTAVSLLHATVAAGLTHYQHPTKYDSHTTFALNIGTLFIAVAGWDAITALIVSYTTPYIMSTISPASAA